MSIITYPLDGIDYDAAAAETYLCTRSSGVFFAEDIFTASVTGDREVSVGPGLAWIRNDDFAGKSVCNTAAVALTIDTADGALPRIDRIVLRFDKTANASSLAVKKGTAASSPAAPSVQQDATVYELGLYTVYVAAASVTVSQSDLTNTMGDSAVCGYMQDGVTAGGMAIAGAEEGALVTTDANGNLVSSSVKVSQLAKTSALGTQATYSLSGTTLTITTK